MGATESGNEIERNRESGRHRNRKPKSETESGNRLDRNESTKPDGTDETAWKKEET